MLRDESIERIKEQFDEKSEVLMSFGEQVSSEELYEDIFGDLEMIMPVVFIDDDEQKHIVKMSIDEAIAQAEDRNDILMGGTTYFKGYISKNTAKDVHSFIIDMDNVYSGPLLQAFRDNWATANGEPTPLPTYMVNSGTGLHLYYVLSEPIPHYHVNAENIDKLYRALAIQQTTKRNFLQRQVQWFGQDFRMGGALNKYNWRNDIYRVGEKWDIDRLGEAVGLKDTHFVRYNEPKPKMKKEAKKREKKKVTGWHTNQAFYKYALERCKAETHEGNRYMSMCALSVIAYKCGVQSSELEHDLQSLLPYYNEKAVRLVRESEIQNAMKMYNEKAMTTPRERLEDWQGWQYKPIKRNGRPQAVHLKIARATRDIIHPEGWRNKDGRPTMQFIVTNFQAQNPTATPKDCIKETGVSKNTVYKWWRK